MRRKNFEMSDISELVAKVERGIIGINEDGRIYEGSDDDIDGSFSLDAREELAKIMIKRWKAFALPIADAVPLRYENPSNDITFTAAADGVLKVTIGELGFSMTFEMSKEQVNKLVDMLAFIV